MSIPDYVHSVEIDENSRLLKIYRTFPNGQKQFYTQIEMPSEAKGAAYKAFAQMLGENLLLDSPVARRILAL